MYSFENKNEFLQDIEIYKEKVLMNREDYSILINEKDRILNEFPNVEKFLKNGEIVDINDEEKDSVLKIWDLEESIKEIEYEEIYKLGGQEAYSYFDKMGMLRFYTH